MQRIQGIKSVFMDTQDTQKTANQAYQITQLKKNRFRPVLWNMEQIRSKCTAEEKLVLHWQNLNFTILQTKNFDLVNSLHTIAFLHRWSMESFFPTCQTKNFLFSTWVVASFFCLIACSGSLNYTKNPLQKNHMLTLIPYFRWQVHYNDHPSATTEGCEPLHLQRPAHFYYKTEFKRWDL